jgi:hypothetical protein
MYAVIQGRFCEDIIRKCFLVADTGMVSVCVLPGQVFPSYTTEICDCPSVCIWYMSFHMILDFTFHATFGRVHINEAHTNMFLNVTSSPLCLNIFLNLNSVARHE